MSDSTIHVGLNSAVLIPQGENYGIFNVLAEGWYLAEADLEQARVEDPSLQGRVVPRSQRWLFSDPLRLTDSYTQAVRLRDNLIKMRVAREGKHPASSLVYSMPEGLVIRKQLVFATDWEDVNEEDNSSQADQEGQAEA
jgi:hypothetical protein